MFTYTGVDIIRFSANGKTHVLVTGDSFELEQTDYVKALIAKGLLIPVPQEKNSSKKDI